MGNKVGQNPNDNYELCSPLSIPLFQFKRGSNRELIDWLQRNFISDRRITQAIADLQDPMMVVKDKFYSRNASGLYLHINFYNKRTQTGARRTVRLKEKDPK
jgi:hypothetical protein